MNYHLDYLIKKNFRLSLNFLYDEFVLDPDIEIGKDENHIFVTFHNYGVENIFYSSDGGETWEEKEGDLPDIPVRCILQNPLSENEVIIGTELGVWYTKDFEANEEWWKRYESEFWDKYEKTVNEQTDKQPEDRGFPKKRKEFELKVDVDQSLCIGCCSCEMIAPGVFTIDKNTKSNPKKQ